MRLSNRIEDRGPITFTHLGQRPGASSASKAVVCLQWSASGPEDDRSSRYHIRKAEVGPAGDETQRPCRSAMLLYTGAHFPSLPPASKSHRPWTAAAVATLCPASHDPSTARRRPWTVAACALPGGASSTDGSNRDTRESPAEGWRPDRVACPIGRPRLRCLELKA